MKIKSLICFLLAFILLFSMTIPVLASNTAATAAEEAAENSGSEDETCSLITFFRSIIARIKAFWQRIIAVFKVKKENSRNTMYRNAIHMLKSVTDTICDSFIITTEDGKVIVVDGGH